MRGAARAWGTPRASNAPERRNCPERTRSRGAPFPRGSCAFQARVLFETRPQAAFRRMGLFLFRIPCGFVRGKAWRRRRPRLCCGARERLARAESFLPQMSRMNTDESPDGAELPSVGCNPTETATKTMRAVSARLRERADAENLPRNSRIDADFLSTNCSNFTNSEGRGNVARGKCGGGKSGVAGTKAGMPSPPNSK